MEVKDEDLNEKQLCTACLSVDREVFEINNLKLKKYYIDVLDEIPLSRSTHTINIMVCQNCKINLQKCWTFIEQIKKSYTILQSYNNQSDQKYDKSDIPKLTGDFEVSLLNNDDVKNEITAQDDTSILSDDDYRDEITNDIDEKEIDTELQTIISSIKVENKKRRCNKESIEVPAEGISTYEKGLIKEDDYDMKEDNLCDVDPDGVTCTQENYDGHLLGNDTSLENDLKNVIISNVRTKKRRNRDERSKVKKSKKIVKSLNFKKNKYRKKLHPDSKVLTIELTYEEMLMERKKDSTRLSYVNSEYKCETCLIGFHYKKSYQAHLLSKHSAEIGEYICPICNTIISSVDSFTNHYKRHMRRYECGICQKRTSDIKVMEQHYYTTHEIALKEYKCNICGKISNSIDTHRYHKDSHKARVQCKECEKTFRHRTGLINHRLAVHEFHNAFPCTICKKVFRWKTSLKRHLEKHNVKDKTPSLPYCSTCNVTFASLCSYQRHMKNSLKHVTQDQLKYICDHCNRRFSDKTKLRDHIEEKHLHKTYICHICAKPSKNRVALDQHIRNVHKGRPKDKMCHHCGRGFPTNIQLESHIRTHTGERPFSCEYCPTTFSQKSNLYKHNRQVHLNMKAKRYPHCKKRKEIDQLKVPLADTTVVDNDPYRLILMT